MTMPIAHGAASATQISRPPSQREYLADRLVTALAYAGAAAIILLVAYILWEIGVRAAPAIAANGVDFLVDLSWDPQRRIFGILPAIWGTLYSSLLALLIGGFFGITIAIFLTQDFLPLRLAIVFRTIIEMLAAIPSVVFGLWGIFVVIPFIRPAADWLHQTLGFIPFFATSLSGPGLLPAALVLAIMVLPTVAAISQDALQLVPVPHQGGGLRHGRDPVGGHPQGDAADRRRRHCQCAGARPRPRARRDDGAGDADRQFQPGQPVAVRAGQHACFADRVRISPRPRRSSARRCCMPRSCCSPSPCSSISAASSCWRWRRAACRGGHDGHDRPVSIEQAAIGRTRGPISTTRLPSRAPSPARC